MRQAIRWALALGLLVGGRAFGLEVRKFTIPPELTDVFREIERDSRESERREAAMVRRVTKLEEDLSDAQSKIAQLETRLSLLRMRLEVTEAAVGHPTTPAGPVPAEGPTKLVPPAGEPKGPTPAPPKPPPAAAARVASEESRTEGESLVVSGTVENTTKAPLTFVIVEATFLDAAEGVVATGSAYTSPRVIPAGGTAKFQIATKPDPRIKSHKLMVKAE
jgi:hypothetical protein